VKERSDNEPASADLPAQDATRREDDTRPPRADCTGCRQRRACLPQTLGEDELALFEAITQPRRPLAAGRMVYRQGQPCRALYALKAGSVKLTQVASDGSETVFGFVFAPGILGMGGIGGQVYDSNAVALEHTAVCEIPFDALCRLSEYVAPLQRSLLRILSQAIVTEQKLAAVVATGSATQRLVAFLLLLAAQNERRGLDPDRLLLPMSRGDIGNFLGLTLETVSRLLSRFARRRWIRVARRDIALLDRAALAAATADLRL